MKRCIVLVFVLVFMAGAAYANSFTVSRQVEVLSESLHDQLNSKNAVIQRLGQPQNIVKDRVTSIHNFNNDPDFIYDRTLFEYDGASIRIIWLDNWHVVDNLEITKPGILKFNGIDIGSSSQDVLKLFGKAKSEDSKLTYLGNSNEKEELDIWVVFTLDGQDRVEKMQFGLIIEVEPL